MTGIPDRTEAIPYYFKYIDLVDGDDVCRVLERQLPDMLVLLQRISDERSLYRYAPDKWSVRQVVNHLNDTERLFTFRAFWFARGFDAPLPSFDQDAAVAAAAADRLPWSRLVEEFRDVRAASLALFQSLSPDAWTRRGIASDNPFSVRALAFLTAGHVTHHMKLLREHYL